MATMTLQMDGRRPANGASPALDGHLGKLSPDSHRPPGEQASNAGGLGHHSMQRRPLRVLFLSVEVEGFAKTGGLGDLTPWPPLPRGEGERHSAGWWP